MSQLLGYETREGTARLILDNPPVNTLTTALRAALWAAIDRAEADPEVGAIVLMARGATFSAGSDVRDAPARAEAPTLAALCDRIEACSKPVLAAIGGTALGGGLELALACHYRIAIREAQLGLPDAALGMVPAAGGIGRLTRLVGARAALDMLISARPVTARVAATLGLVDRVIEKNLARAALGSARNMAEAGVQPRPTRARREGLDDPARFLEVVAARRALVAADPRAVVRRIVDLVEAVLLLPAEAAAAMEAVAHDDLAASDQARGLRHSFLAERRAARFVTRPGLAPVAITRIGLFGDGSGAAAALALAALAGGLRVSLVGPDPDRLQAETARLEAGLAEAVARGTLTRPAAEARRAQLTHGTDPGLLAEAGALIAAVDPATPSPAQRLALAGLAAGARGAAVLATTAPEGALDGLAAETGHPAGLIGMRLLPEAGQGRLVEVSQASATPAGALVTAAEVVRRMGKVPVWSAAVPGGVGLRVMGAAIEAAEALVLAGADPLAVDRAMTDYGFGLGPFAWLDRVGLSLPGLRPGAFVAALRAAGRLGRAGGAGVYHYDGEGRRLGPDPGLAASLEAARGGRAGLLLLRPEEVQDRLVLAMANRGAALLAAGEVRRAGDIDAALILGFGFPRWQGGPMAVADRLGPLEVRKRLRDWAAGGPGDSAPTRDGQSPWAPSPLFDVLIREGRRFGEGEG